MVAADEPNARKHMELESVPNLQVYRILSTVTDVALSKTSSEISSENRAVSRLNILRFTLWRMAKCCLRFLRAL